MTLVYIHKLKKNILKINRYELILNKLQTSKFRNSFHLKIKEINYINEKGIDKIKSHAIDFINEKLGPANPQNDGKQTPMKNHPVFIAMHACACCCRSCLYKWHHISKNKELTNEEKDYILNLLMLWIERELINNTN